MCVCPSRRRGVLVLVYRGLVFQEIQTQVAAPAPFRGFGHRGVEAVHVVAPVTVVTEQKLVIVLRGPAHIAALALDALPAVGLHGCHHDGRELETGGVT